jgi:hypothetical protein
MCEERREALEIPDGTGVQEEGSAVKSPRSEEEAEVSEVSPY